MPAPLVVTAAEGDSTGTVAGAVTTNTLIKSGSGNLAKVLVTSVNGAAAINIYDAIAPSSGAITGTIIGVIPASAAAGTVVTFGMPFVLGCIVGGAATNGALTISYH